MILGNDGGIHVTHDRMTHWDHLNHVAIGQFYHVGVDATKNYKVYGGMQDNGSWGGPSRTQDGRGPVNTHWFRVGGGDGFICLVDPTDPDLIHYESQNGAMRRTNLRTRAAGSNRPRSERGKPRYRFNWKTPFILSPHNPSIFYSAGNHVFRSNTGGSGSVAISPDITNTDKGAGSAISQSPADENVIYVGTTDGAIWMTKDGGKEWTPIFSRPQKKKKDDKEKKGDDAKKDPQAAPGKKVEKKEDPPKRDPKKKDAKAKDDSKKDETQKPKSEKADNASFGGTWDGTLSNDRLSDEMRAFEMKLDGDAEKVTGTYTSPRGTSKITSGTFDKKSGELELKGKNDRVRFTISAKVKGDSMSGTIEINDGDAKIEFEAKRKKGASNPSMPMSATAAAAAIGLLTDSVQDDETQDEKEKADDGVSGTWEGVLDSDEIPKEESEFVFIIKMDKKGGITGKLEAGSVEGEITGGKFDKKKNRISMTIETSSFNAEVFAHIKGNTMSGEVDVASGQTVVDFDATRIPTETAEKPEEEPSPKTEQDSDSGEKKSAAQDKDAKTLVQDDKKEAAKKDDPIAGQWKGVMIIRENEREISFDLKRDQSGKITGTYETGQGQGEISGGKYDPKSKKVEMFADNENFSMTFRGSVKKNSIKGEVEAAGGRFTFDFEIQRTGKGQTSETAQSQTQPKGKKFETLVPGPRWVSSIEASRFKAERCYLTLDGHRSNDDEPYVFMTNDQGKTWTSIRGNLPTSAGSTRVIREDLVNPNVLYLGCEFSAWVSVDRGGSWTRLSGLPTVAVHELALHPTMGEVVAATHGRSLWIGDVSVLRQITAKTLKADSHLYRPATVIRWHPKPFIGNSGTRRFVGTNPSQDAKITYSLGKRARSVEITIRNIDGRVVQRIEGKTDAGLHNVTWNMRGRDRRRARTGIYLVTLTVDDVEHNTRLQIEADPGLPEDALRTEELEAQALREMDLAEPSEEGATNRANDGWN